jgi:hypothetical protein
LKIAFSSPLTGEENLLVSGSVIAARQIDSPISKRTGEEAK